MEDLETGEQFSGRGFVERNLDAMRNELIDKRDKDMVILVVGMPGNGKSAFTAFCGNYLKKDFSEDNFVYTAEDSMKAIKSWPKNSFINIDEGYDVFFSRNAMTKANKEAIKTFYKYRYKNHIIFINFQNIEDVEPRILKRVHGLFRVVKQGWVHGFSKQSVDRIDINKRKKSVDWPEPDLRDSFPNPEKAIPGLWADIAVSKDERLDGDGVEGEEHKGLADMNVKGVTKAAKMLGVAKNTVYSWVEKGDLGAYNVNGTLKIPYSEIQSLIEKK